MVVLAALVSTAAFGAMGWLFASNIDATYTETVAEPWDDDTCQQFAQMTNESNLSSTPENCALDEPKTRTVQVSDVVWNGFLGRLPLVFLGTLFGWLVVAAGLHGLSALAGGEGSFGETLAVTGWGMLPSVAGTLLGVVAFWLAVGRVEFASDPQLLADQVQRLAAGGLGPLHVVGTLLSVGWQAYIWPGGLEEARDLDRPAALFVVGVVGFALLLSSLL